MTALRRVLASCALAALAASPAAAQRGAPEGSWPQYAGDLGSTKYSPLDQIKPVNVKRLGIAWRWASIDAPLFTEEFQARVRGGRIDNLKVTPVFVDGVLYVCTPLYQAAAIDAATGKTLWTHDPHAYDALPAMSINFNQRGGAYWSDGKEARYLWGTGDGRLIAVDAKTGERCAGFGAGGEIDLAEGIANARPGELDHRKRHYYSVASPPTICRDVVVVPCSISDDPVYKEEPAGHIRGYDVRSGKLLWTFHTVPQEGEPGVETWEGESWRYTGGTNVWSPLSADEELGYFYLPIGTPTSDWYGGHRLGAGLYAECLVCLEAATGRRVWHYQIVHHGLWDYDPPCAPNLIDINVGGKAIKAVAQVTKHGFVFVFDRVTGEPVWPIEERAVPESDIPGEKVSPTQPFPTKPPPFERQGVSVDDLIDFTPALREEAEKIVKDYRIGPLFTPPSLATPERKGTIINPGWGGGANWTGAAVDPETAMIYIPSTTGPIVPVIVEPAAGTSNLNYVRKSIAGVRGPQGLPLMKPPWARVTAINLNTGEIAWQAAHGETSAKIAKNPALAGVALPPLGVGGKGGPLVTKTLLFVPKRGEGGEEEGESGGGDSLTAYDKATGAVVAEIPLPRPARGAPMTYKWKGRQYIAITVSGAPPELIALALPAIAP